MKIEYKGHTIEVTHELKFLVKGPEFEARNFEFSSKLEATQAIDTRVAAAEKQKRTEATVKVNALHGSTGNMFTIRGLNRNNSSVLGCPAELRYPHLWDIFPDVPWIKALLVERAQLMDRVTEITEQVRPFGQRDGSGYGGRISPERYDTALETFLSAHKGKKEAAEAAAPAPFAEGERDPELDMHDTFVDQLNEAAVLCHSAGVKNTDILAALRALRP